VALSLLVGAFSSATVALRAIADSPSKPVLDHATGKAGSLGEH